MFELDWANRKAWRQEERFPEGFMSSLKTSDVAALLKLRWEEHCVECAIPDCYTSCRLYTARKDSACARFSYGIVPNFNFKGHYNFGADIKFKKWAKLEANLDFTFLGPIGRHSLLSFFTKLSLEAQVYWLSKIRRLHQQDIHQVDAFVLECFSPAKDSYQLYMEYFVEQNGVRETKFRHAFKINAGVNFYKVPFSSMNMTALEGYVCLYLDNDIDRRLVFTWLDFVKFRRKVPASASVKQRHGEKIKCVAWDLDNTLWRGILAEGGSPILKPESEKLIVDLDNRGIVQTILSKNNHEEAIAILRKMDLERFFLYPAINWGQKSESLKIIASKLNIDLNTVAVIDDSEFERHEIANALPQVRTYDEQQIPNIIKYPEFDVPITSEAKNRRASYLQEIERDRIKEGFAGSYDDFLRSCDMRLEVYVPKKAEEIERLLELIHRSNQLNLSSNRYSAETFETLLGNPKVLSLALRCSDRFGEYGLVGFASIDLSDAAPVLNDFLLSCRVARKKVEHAFMYGLAEYLHSRGYPTLNAIIVKTNKNLPLRQVFEELPFKTLSEKGNLLLLNMITSVRRPVPAIAQLVWSVELLSGEA